VVPTVVPRRGPDISLDMRQGADSVEAAGSDGSEPLAVGVSGPLGPCGATDAAAIAAYFIPPSGDPLFTRGFRGARWSWHGSCSGRRAPGGGLRRVTRAGQVDGFPLPSGPGRRSLGVFGDASGGGAVNPRGNRRPPLAVRSLVS
jgi:hypothetical protein